MSKPTSKLLVATGNRHKAREIEAILREALSGHSFEIVSLAQYPGVPEAIEDGDSFEANAVKKAIHYAKATGLLALADDSGLVVDALDGRPGIRSARYAETSGLRNARVLRELEGTAADRRTARFVCVAALGDPVGRVATAEGRIEGWIFARSQGEGGFGYDPIFEAEQNGQRSGRSLAEYSAEEKNAISHRGRAIRAIVQRLGPALEAGHLAGD